MLNCWPSGLLKKKIVFIFLMTDPNWKSCVFSKFISGIYGKWTYENCLQFLKKEVWQLELNVLALLAFLSVYVEFMPNTKNVYIVWGPLEKKIVWFLFYESFFVSTFHSFPHLATLVLSRCQAAQSNVHRSIKWYWY